MISVCMATYNGERFIRRQLETILPQLAADDELVISDDSSTDATLAIIGSFVDPRIRLFPGQTFRSPIFNFEHAVKQSLGEVIVLADQDDVWLPCKLETVRAKFASRPPGPYLLALDGLVVDEDEQVICDSIFAKLNAGPGFCKNLFDNRYLGCCLAFSRELLDWALPFPQRIPMHDMWLGQLCELVGRTEFLPVKTILYRKHGQSLTDFRIRFIPWTQLKRRWFLAWHLLARSLRGKRNEEKGSRGEENLVPQSPNLVPRASCLEPELTIQISVVMPSYNQVQFLEEAVSSVLDQSGVEVELLVMDPGSSDGSRELLLCLRMNYGERLRLVFEEDSGQSEAVNRGMKLARGRVLAWLNSDDRFRPGSLARAVSLLDRDTPLWLYGRAGIIDEKSAPVSSFIVSYKNWRGNRFSRWKLLTENFIPQMAVFWNRSLWDHVAGLDHEKHLDMDYDLWLRFAEVAAPVVLTDELADFRVHGAAKGSRQTGKQLDAAFATARMHAAGMGISGWFALFLHRLLSLRTRIIYLFIKP
jgi:glycosyltransferase involved in cell wall biosynthesis